MSVMVYKCPQCGASLSFDADKQSWDCKFCLGSYDVETLEKRLAQDKEKVFAEEPEEATPEDVRSRSRLTKN